MQSEPTTCWHQGCGPRQSTVRSNALLDITISRVTLDWRNHGQAADHRTDDDRFQPRAVSWFDISTAHDPGRSTLAPQSRGSRFSGDTSPPSATYPVGDSVAVTELSFGVWRR